MHTWKCNSEIPCVALANKQKCHLFSFTKSKNRRAEQVLSRGVDISRWGVNGEEGDYNVNTVCM
jgi:hypothetical protein